MLLISSSVSALAGTSSDNEEGASSNAKTGCLTDIYQPDME
jgi:hypothetical protein